MSANDSHENMVADHEPASAPASETYSAKVTPQQSPHIGGDGFDDSVYLKNESDAESTPAHSVAGTAPSSPVSRPVGRLRALSRAKSSTANLTQQQVNKKRQRATPEQLAVLEETFAVNPSPTSKIREAVAAKINMTERSVQIWFQNRRAKVKLLQKKSEDHDSDEEIDETNGLPPTHLFDTTQPNAFGMEKPTLARSNSLGHGPNVFAAGQPAFFAAPLSPFAPVGMPQVRSVAEPVSCQSLTIGTWSRIACNENDLVIYYSPTEARFTYYVNSGLTGFRIEFGFNAISSITVTPALTPQLIPGQQNVSATVFLRERPIFFMEVPAVGGWRQCTDFTEQQQATSILQHTLIGPAALLVQQFTKLATTSRGNPMVTIEPSLMIFNAGLQAVPSIPSQVSTPDVPSTPSLIQQQQQQPPPNPQHLMPPGAGKGHRRQRSRSLPPYVDFSTYSVPEGRTSTPAPVHPHTTSFPGDQQLQQQAQQAQAVPAFQEAQMANGGAPVAPMPTLASPALFETQNHLSTPPAQRDFALHPSVSPAPVITFDPSSSISPQPVQAFSGVTSPVDVLTPLSGIGHSPAALDAGSLNNLANQGQTMQTTMMDTSGMPGAAGSIFPVQPGLQQMQQQISQQMAEQMTAPQSMQQAMQQTFEQLQQQQPQAQQQDMQTFELQQQQIEQLQQLQIAEHIQQQQQAEIQAAIAFNNELQVMQAMQHQQNAMQAQQPPMDAMQIDIQAQGFNVNGASLQQAYSDVNVQQMPGGMMPMDTTGFAPAADQFAAMQPLDMEMSNAQLQATLAMANVNGMGPVAGEPAADVSMGGFGDQAS
ncbi:hypothetical protein YB2330_000554 [Saitoella coloradoensis]